MLRLLRRALDLHAEVPTAEVTPIGPAGPHLYGGRRTGEHEEELAAIEDTLAGLDRERQPLLASELLVRRRYLRDATGRAFSLADAPRRSICRPATRAVPNTHWPWQISQRSKC